MTIPPKTVKEIVAGIKRGDVATKLAYEHGITAETVKNIASRHGLEMARPTNACLEEVKKLASEGLSITEIASSMGLTINQSRSLVRTHGIRTAADYIQKPIAAFAILERLINSDETQANITKQFGISRQRVGQIKRTAETSGIQLYQAPEKEEPDGTEVRGNGPVSEGNQD